MVLPAMARMVSSADDFGPTSSTSWSPGSATSSASRSISLPGGARLEEAGAEGHAHHRRLRRDRGGHRDGGGPPRAPPGPDRPPRRPAGSGGRRARDLGAEAACWPADLDDPETPARLVAEVAGRFGGLDVLVNNAGFGLPSLFGRTDPEAIRKQLNVNLIAPSC